MHQNDNFACSAKCERSPSAILFTVLTSRILFGREICFCFCFFVFWGFFFSFCASGIQHTAMCFTVDFK